MSETKNPFETLKDNILEYAEVRVKLIVLTVQERLTEIITSIALFLIVGLLATLVFVFGSFGLAILIGKWLGSYFAGFFVMAAFNAILLLLIWFKAAKWIKIPIINFLLKKINNSGKRESK